MSTLAQDAEALDRLAKFPKGKPADPTSNMTSEQKAQWEAMKDEHGDKFKQANGDMLQYFADHPDKLREKLMRDKAKGKDAATKLQPNAKRPGPYIEIAGKPGLWQVTRFQPHETEPVLGVRTIGEIAWGEVKKVTKAGKTTGKGFEAKFLASGNKMSVNWKGRAYLSTTYKEVKTLPSKKARDELAMLDMDLVSGSIPHIALDRDLAALEMHGRLAAIDRAADSQIGKTIIEQMGGSRAMAMIGATQIVYLKDGVGVKWPNKTRSKGNYFEVRLTPADEYDLEFFNVSMRGKKSVTKHRGVYFDQLAGLFEKQTGWYLRMAAGQMERLSTDEGDLLLSRFEEGESADPTENMSEEDAKKWRLENLKNKDKFKGKEAGSNNGFEEGSRIPDGWDSGHIDGEEEDEKKNEGSDTPDGSGNVDKRAGKKPSGEGINGYNAAVKWQDKGDEKRARAEYIEAAKQMGMPTAKMKSMPLAKLQQALKAALVKQSKVEGVSYTLHTPKGGKNAFSVPLYAFIDYDGLYGASEDEAASSRGFWARRVPQEAFAQGRVARVVGAPMPLIEKLVDVGTRASKLGPQDAFVLARKYLARGKQARTGLYGFTKKVQADCETSVRKVQKAAHRIAKAAYGKNEKVAEFLSSHAGRSDSLPAHILVAALGEMGPKVAQEMARTARLEELRAARAIQARLGLGKVQDGKQMTLTSGDVYAHVWFDADVATDDFGRPAKDSGEWQVIISTSQDPLNMKPRGRELARETFRYVEAKARSSVLSMAETWVTQNLGRLGRRANGDTSEMLREEADKTAAPRGKGQQAIANYISGWKAGDSEDLTDISRDATFRGIHFAKIMSAAEALKKSGMIDFDGVKVTKKAGGKTARSYGLYGFGDKVAQLGLSACTNVRAEAGRIAYDLHRRRTAKHDRITGFLDQHCKTAECRYSKLLHASYPAADSKAAALEEPRTVAAWLTWED